MPLFISPLALLKEDPTTVQTNPLSSPTRDLSKMCGNHRAGKPPSAEEMRPHQIATKFKGAEIEDCIGFMRVQCPGSSEDDDDDAELDCCGLPRHHLDSMAIAIDGACPGNGTPTAKAACGVYFGREFEDSYAAEMNLSWRIIEENPNQVHTSQRAELSAAIGALQLMKAYAQPSKKAIREGRTDYFIHHAVIKTDSAYLVNSITCHIEKWMRNGWKTAVGKDVANRDLWEKLVAAIADANDWGCHVEFWLVPREMNREADRLAKLGLSSLPRRLTHVRLIGMWE